METITPDISEEPTLTAPPLVQDPPANREPVIDEPGKEIPAVDPRRPGEPRTIREPEPMPGEPEPGPGTAN